MNPRAVAQQILHERRFHRSSFPQPLRRPLHWIGDRLRPIGHAISSAADSIGRLFGPAWVGWLVLAGLLALVIWLVVRRFGDVGVRSAQRREEAEAAAGVSRRDLQREADAAERAGRFADAVRLRFRAGLVGLADRGVVEGRPSLRRAEVAQELDSPRFDELADMFDAVTYGGRPADADDAGTARREWDRVLQETRR